MNLDQRDHDTLALWAADCAEHVLAHFEASSPADPRPRAAIDAARGWVRGELSVRDARSAAFASRAASRDAADPAARAAARAAGHAAATAHVAGHARRAATYAVTAVTEAAAAEERQWQHARLPDRLYALAFGEQA